MRSVRSEYTHKYGSPGTVRAEQALGARIAAELPTGPNELIHNDTEKGHKAGPAAFPADQACSSVCS